jgi:glycosyltransferase involved in cell wall biosynthesis
MKVVHISTFDSGGAGIAASRLHEGLIRQGIDTSFLTLHQSKNNRILNNYKYNGQATGSLFRKITRHFPIDLTQSGRNKRMVKGLTGTYEMFSFPLTDFRVEDHQLLKEADIINLHWISNFINFPTFFNAVQKSIVWTLHDMNPVMGGFHYLNDRIRNERNFGEVEERLAKVKVKYLSNVKNLSIVTPSKWLMSHAKNSQIFNNLNMRVIPYGLDLAVFKPHNRAFARSIFNIPEEKIVFLYVSENLGNLRKGFDLLNEAFSKMGSISKLLLVSIGHGENRVSLDNVLFLGKISDNRLMSLLYSAADVFVLPSREDNLPNVMLESMACGTPVIAFSTGGMKEVIIDNFNGILVDELSSKGLHDTLIRFVDGQYTFDQNAIRAFCERNFGLDIQAKQYIDFYHTILQENI